MPRTSLAARNSVKEAANVSEGPRAARKISLKAATGACQVAESTPIESLNSFVRLCQNDMMLQIASGLGSQSSLLLANAARSQLDVQRPFRRLRDRIMRKRDRGRRNARNLLHGRKIESSGRRLNGACGTKNWGYIEMSLLGSQDCDEEDTPYS
jgi:hypothetical protein